MFILQKMQQLLGKETRISSKISPHVFYEIRQSLKKFHLRGTNVFQFGSMMSLPVMSLQHMHILDLSWLTMMILSFKSPHFGRHFPVLIILAIF